MTATRWRRHGICTRRRARAQASIGRTEASASRLCGPSRFALRSGSRVLRPRFSRCTNGAMKGRVGVWVLIVREGAATPRHGVESNRCGGS